MLIYSCIKSKCRSLNILSLDLRCINKLGPVVILGQNDNKIGQLIVTKKHKVS